MQALTDGRGGICTEVDLDGCLKAPERMRGLGGGICTEADFDGYMVLL